VYHPFDADPSVVLLTADVAADAVDHSSPAKTEHTAQEYQASSVAAASAWA